MLQYLDRSNDLPQLKDKNNLSHVIAHLLSNSKIPLSTPLEKLLRFLEEFLKQASDDDVAFLFKESA